MKALGDNTDYGLGGSLYYQRVGSKDIKTEYISRLDPKSLLSFSSYRHSVWIMQNGEAVAVGDNCSGQIISTMPKTKFQKDTKIEFQDKNGKPCNFTSAVCGYNYTLYKLSCETSSDPSQLVYAHSKKETIFLNIGKRSPVSLFGGSHTSAVIDAEGGVIIITESVFDSPESEIECLSLPDFDKAVKAACCDDSVIVVSESGRVFECRLGAGKKSFSEVAELSGMKIVEISGVEDYFFAVSEDGRVFGRGYNGCNKLGMPNGIKQLNEFKFIESMNNYHVVEAFTGLNESIFKTSEGRIFGCGWNGQNILMLQNERRINVYPPEETMVTGVVTFCIIGSEKLVAFLGVEPPPNTPNRKVKFSKTVDEIKSDSNQAKFVKELSDEKEELRKLLDKTQKENSALKEELAQSKKRISELEKEVEELKEKANTSKEENSTKTKNEISIIDSETLDKLKRVKSVGRGATSEVFMVSREERLALKVYYPESLTVTNASTDSDSDNDNDDDEEKAKPLISADNARRFLLEYESINALDHPHIIKAYGISFGDSKHPPSILLEYCPSNLKKKIKKLSDSERIKAIVDLSSAMKEVHSVGLIHRDLKLENILVDDNNEIKVSDFGLCTLMSVEAETKSRTQMTGTLKYMAPELLQERTDYDEKVDVYSFGVVVFLILTKGEFPDISLVDVGMGKKAKIPTSFSEFSRNLIDKCWSFKASDRPSFSEICETLQGNENKLI